MKFAPKPQNDFLLFMRTYYDRCRAVSPHIRATAAKWTFEDFIPGLSDIDVRLIFANGMEPQHWSDASEAIGQVHARLCHEFPHWARNLEHLPGINLTVDEITSPRLFYSEFHQWSFYDGEPEVLDKIHQTLHRVKWSSRDELYHLKKFATYCGPYRRGIDPPINVGCFENKYPLHSRYMHYFAPPVQAAMSLLHRRNIPGKQEALRMARSLLPNPRVIDRLFETLDRHYEVPEDYQEPRLSQLERELDQYLKDAWAALEGSITRVDHGSSDSPDAIRGQVAAVKAEPVAAFFEGAKFGRLLKGRLLFYAESIPHFDSTWLIRNELGRAAENFYNKPLGIYGQVRYGGQWTANQVLRMIRGELLTEEQCDAMTDFAKLVDKPIPPGLERERSREAARAYDNVLFCLERLGKDLLERMLPESNTSLP